MWQDRTALAVAMLVMATLTSAQGSPPSSAEADRIQALVEKAAALVEARGVAAFAEFRKPESDWWFGTTYLFAYDHELNVLLNPAFPHREGTNPSGETDANGKAFHDEFLETVQAQGSGWVDYMFPRPGESVASQKWSYVKAVDIDGATAILGAGFYPE